MTALYRDRCVIGNATLYLGDCLDILPTLVKADALITDPPYGIGLGTHAGAADIRSGYLGKQSYESYDDTRENFALVVAPAIGTALKMTTRGAVFCMASAAGLLPSPSALGGVYLPSGCGRSSWGFTNFAPLYLYGASPTVSRGASHTVLQSAAGTEKNGHPCPKPIEWMRWVVGIASLAGETVLDPFMGSGTTGVACMQLGRRFVGIEIEPKYYAIACERIENAQRQQSLLDPYDATTRSYEQVSLAL